MSAKTIIRGSLGNFTHKWLTHRDDGVCVRQVGVLKESS